MAESFNLFRQTPRLQIAFNPQAASYRQSVGGGRIGHGFAAPQRRCSELFKGAVVQVHQILPFLTSALVGIPSICKMTVWVVWMSPEPSLLSDLPSFLSVSVRVSNFGQTRIASAVSVDNTSRPG